MTIINVNSISGINSITAQGASGIEFFDSSGSSVQKVTGDGLTVGTGASVHNPASNVLTLGTNDEERLRIDSSGDIEIAQGKNLTWVYEGGSTHRARIRAESTDALIFENGFGNTEQLRITSAGNVGIGTDNPTKALHLAQNSDIAIRMDANNANADARAWEIVVGGNASNNAEMVFRTRLDDGTGGSECARIKRNGIITLPSGGGIDFHNYGTGTGVSSNLLDDYEEGTWTPQLTQGIVGTPSYSIQIGWYTKIGREVQVYFYLRVGSTGNTGDNNVFRVGNFPFQVSSSHHNTYNRGMGVSNYHSIPGFTSANVSLYGGGSSTTYASLYQGDTPVGTNVAVNLDYIIGGFKYISE